MTQIRAAALVALVLAALSCVGPAIACDQIERIERGQFVTGELALLPSNAAGLVWALMDEKVLPRFVVERLPSRQRVKYRIDSTPLPFPLNETHVLIRPREGFEPGAVYEFRSEEQFPQTARVEVSDHPVQAGGTAWLEVGTPFRSYERFGDCGLINLELALLPVQLRLPIHARDLAPELVYQTLVDGRPWHYHPYNDRQVTITEHGPGRDVLITLCERFPTKAFLKAGPHHVEIRALLPGTDLVWSAAADVDLPCPPQD